ncbi:MAG: hypothetical protein E6R03_07320 [Hyphomicrobiaceae bacterium]|nr:MAG: hypothetical protein E6R03_07320 [Hyphomicrobiaceae bacterium]
MRETLEVENTEQAATPETVAQPSEAVTPDVAEQSVETEATENQDAVTDEQKNQQAQKEEKEKTEKRARGVQKRMDELTRDKYAERQAREALEKQNAELLSILKGQSKPAATSESDGRPDPAKYVHGEADAQFIRDDAAWIAEQRTKSMLEQLRREQSEQTAKATQEQSERAVANAYMARQREIAKSIPDYDATMTEGAHEISVPNPVFDLIRRMPDGPLVAYHMVKNPALTEQFFSNPPELHGILLGQLSATLKGAAKISNAPPPSKPLQAKASSSSTPPEDTAAYFAWAEKHMR